MTQEGTTAAARLRTLLTLAWPIVLARATQAVVGFCDALMTAPLGEKALAAVTTGAMNVFSFVMLPMGTTFILQSFAAQLRGRGDVSGARRYAYYGLLLALGAGLFAAVTTPLLGRVIATIGFEPEVGRAMDEYMAIRLYSVAAIVGVEALGNWYGGMGNTRLSMIAGVITMVANVIGNYALIEPRFGLPGYGAAGAAWASTLSSWLGFAVILALFWSGWGIPASPGAPGRLRMSEFLRMLRFGVPSGVNWFLEFAAFVLFINVVVGHLGTTVLAAFNVVFQINSISFMPAFGVASAGAILCGEAIGSGKRDDVIPIVKLTLAVTCAWMVSVGIVYLALPRPLIGLFEGAGRPAPELIAAGTVMLGFCGVWQVFDAIGITLTEALRSAGDTAWPMGARIALAWGLFTPLSWVAVFHWGGGIATIMLSIVLYIAALAVLLWFRFWSGRWKTIELVGEPEVV
ncbi:MAG TPA: MATE family efflux transporter [Polyangiaceae bacterium]|nr:MATE family efflux transporter [Polyangiaceae bacterium]